MLIEPHNSELGALQEGVDGFLPVSRIPKVYDGAGNRNPSDSRIGVGGVRSGARASELQAKIDTALAAAQPVRVRRSLSDAHPRIRKWIDEDRCARERARESVYSPAALVDHAHRGRSTPIENPNDAVLGVRTNWLWSEGGREKQKPIVIQGRLAHLNFS